MMKLAIVGARNPPISYQEFIIQLEQTAIDRVDTIVSGGAVGIDSYAKQYAEENNLRLIEYLPIYSMHGRKAPIVRNSLIVKEADAIVAFPTMDSKGTHDTIRKMRKAGKQVIVIQL